MRKCFYLLFILLALTLSSCEEKKYTPQPEIISGNNTVSLTKENTARYIKQINIDDYTIKKTDLYIDYSFYFINTVKQYKDLNIFISGTIRITKIYYDGTREKISYHQYLSFKNKQTCFNVVSISSKKDVVAVELSFGYDYMSSASGTLYF